MENKNMLSITRIDNDKYQLSVIDEEGEVSIDMNQKEAEDLGMLIAGYIAKIKSV